MDIPSMPAAIFAGLLTFLLPCTLPLVPGYLAFISGVSLDDLNDPKKAKTVRRKVFLNGLLYVIGFSAVFILIGTIFGAGGVAFAKYRIWLIRASGVLIILFGLVMMHVLKLPFLNKVQGRIGQLGIMNRLTPGKPGSSFLIGTLFALFWAPCVGPLLGVALSLASIDGGALQGAYVLSGFSLGLAIPFLLIAIGIGHAMQTIQKIAPVLNIISFIGGVIFVILGIFLATNSYTLLLSYFYEYLDFFNYEGLLQYL